MLNEFLSLPTILLTLLTSIIGASTSLLLLFYFRRKFGNELFSDNHDVSSVFFNALGLLYAVLVSFVVFATWNAYSQADLDVEIEANQIHNLFLTTHGLPDEYRPEARRIIIEYLNIVIKEDWEYLKIEENNPNSKAVLLKLWKYYLDMKNLNSGEVLIIYKESLARLSEITNSRRLRIQSSQNDIPPILWVVIIIGSISSVVFSLFFKAKNIILQSIITATFAIVNSLIILLILVLDHTFVGDSGVSNEPFVYVLSYIKDYLSTNTF